MGTYLKRNYKTLKKTGGNAEKMDAYWFDEHCVVRLLFYCTE